MTDQSWLEITRFGAAGLLLPALFALTLYACLRARTAVTSLRWLLPVGCALMITAASKIAFMGFGLGIASIDFTGFSGHSTLAASIYPVLAYLLVSRTSPPVRRGAVVLAYAAALIIMVSRYKVGGHSVPEAIAGFALGATASATALWQMRRWRSQGSMLGVGVGVLAWILVITIHGDVGPTFNSHEMVTQVALKLSHRSQPYTREDLHARLI